MLDDDLAKGRTTHLRHKASTSFTEKDAGIDRPSVPESRHRAARARDQLPHPELSASHSKNQLQPLFSARVEPDMKERIDRWIKTMGWSKRQATEYAFEFAMRNTPKP
jgi:hypothetical protein